MTDQRKNYSCLISGSSLRTVEFGAQLTVAFLLTPFIIGKLGDSMYGLWTLIASVVGYYGLLDLGLSVAVTRHFSGALGAADHEGCNRAFNTSLWLFSFIGVVALLISLSLMAAAPYFCRTPEHVTLFRTLILILGSDLALSMPARAYGGMLTSSLKFSFLATLQLAALVVRSVLIVVMLNLGFGIVTLALVNVSVQLPVRLMHVVFAHRHMPFLRISRRYLSWSMVKQLFSFSSYMFIAQLGDQLRFHVDYLVITAFLGLAYVTQYKIASMLVHYHSMLMSAVTGVLYPLFGQMAGGGNIVAIRKIFMAGTRLSMVIASFVTFGLVAWGKPFIHLWVGRRFVETYPCLVILSISFMVMLWQATTMNLFIGLSRQKVIAGLNASEGIANLALSLILVKPFGIVGVALGTAIPMLVIKLFVQPLYACQTAGIPLTDYAALILRTLFHIGVSLTGPLILSLLFARPSLWVLFAVGASSLFLYTITIWHVELIPVERRQVLATVAPMAEKTFRLLPLLNRTQVPALVLSRMTGTPVFLEPKGDNQ